MCLQNRFWHDPGTRKFRLIGGIRIAPESAFHCTRLVLAGHYAGGGKMPVESRLQGSSGAALIK